MDLSTEGLNPLSTPDSKIPVPSLDFLRKVEKAEGGIVREGKIDKHERAYDAYCRWMATPKARREPKTEVAFESKWKVPKHYAATFRQRGDYRNRMLLYFWEWMMDNMPDFFENLMQKSFEKGGSAERRILAEIYMKHTETQKPAQQITQIVIQGVEQAKINNLFVPDEYKEIDDVIPEK